MRTLFKTRTLTKFVNLSENKAKAVCIFFGLNSDNLSPVNFHAPFIFSIPSVTTLKKVDKVYMIASIIFLTGSATLRRKLKIFKSCGKNAADMVAIADINPLKNPPSFLSLLS